jgi:hypothetical protein
MLLHNLKRERNEINMKKTIKIYAAGLLTGILLFGSTLAFAEPRGVIRELFFNVNVVVDGIPQAFAHDMRPFIAEGRTFLPVRGIADALNVGVDWDADTSTVFLWSGSPTVQVPVPTPIPTPQPTPQPPTMWLDQMGHLNYERSDSRNLVSNWVSGNTATDGTAFERGLRFENFAPGRSGNTPPPSTQSFEVALNYSYTNFSGVLVRPSFHTLNMGFINNNSTQVRFYGDGRLLYTSPTISNGTVPTHFDIDVNGIFVLSIHVDIPNPLSNNGNDTSHTGIVNARFE